MKMVWLVLALSLVGCMTPAKARGQQYVFCEKWISQGRSPAGCEDHAAQKATYEQLLERRAESAKAGGPKAVCVEDARTSFEECTGQTPMGGAHPNFNHDDERCRSNFDAAVAVCNATATAGVAP